MSRPQSPEPERSAGQPVGPWRRLFFAFGQSSSRTKILVVALAVLLGLGVSTQVRQTREQGMESLRQEDLVSILDTVDQRAARLDAETQRLSQQRAQLEREQPGGPAAVAAARTRADSLAILAGTVAATGPGVRIVIGSADKVGASTYLDAVQELRDAGAEAIQVGSARVVASTAFADSGDSAIVVDGKPLITPVTILAVGDSQTLTSAMNIPGGVVESVRGLGASIEVSASKSVLVNALHTVTAPRYARPESAPSPGSG